jgi:hypothetical protein
MDKYDRLMNYSKANGWLFTPKRELYAIYLIPRLADYRFDIPRERTISKHVFIEKLHNMELFNVFKAIFITFNTQDKHLLLRGEDIYYTKKKPPGWFWPKPVYPFENDYEILNITEAYRIQQITGCLERNKVK